MKATKLISALHEQVEKLLVHQNKQPARKTSGPQKPAKVRRIIQHNEPQHGTVVTA